MPLTAEQRAAINRANAQKSTGPKSAEGKASSAQNALKHGLTARAGVLVPGEDPTEHQSFVQEWFDGYAPNTPGRRALVERAADVAWKLRRLGRAGDARAALAARDAEKAFDVEQVRRAEALGDCLRFDNPVPTQPRRTRSRTSAIKTERVHPAAVNRELESFAQGVRWKIQRWVELRALLDEDTYWEWDAKYLAIRLMGVRPEDAMIDLGVRHIFQWARVIHPNGDKFINDVAHATQAHPERSRNEFLANKMSLEKTVRPSDARDRLKELARYEIDRLKAMLPALQDRATLDRAEAPLRAHLDAITPALQRYETTLDRTLRQTIAALDGTEPDAPAFAHEEPRAEIEIPPCEPEVETPAPPAPEAQPEPVAATPPPARTVVLPRQNEANPPAAEPVAATVSHPRTGWHPPLSGVA